MLEALDTIAKILSFMYFLTQPAEAQPGYEAAAESAAPPAQADERPVDPERRQLLDEVFGTGFEEPTNEELRKALEELERQSR